MAEVKNSFLRSKMNKDLDDRLIPNGEYRDANNISVGKSEESDIGALETILGNSIAALPPAGYPAGLEVIGYFSSETNNTIYYFATDNTNHYIFKFTQPSDWQILVTGSFLNFNKSFPVNAISLIENLLFFTDDYNQPRKINVESAASDVNYYKDESQISVAKYNPYEPISLLEEIEITLATTQNPATAVITLAAPNALIKPGMLLVTSNSTNNDEILANEYLYVISNSNVTVTLNAVPSQTIQSTDKLYFLNPTMTGQEISAYFDNVEMPDTGGALTWPGDPDYLEDRFARFSYRFQYDDGEYSIMAPFTPITFIPKQKGYFLDGDEDETYKSTVVDFMENGVQNINLLISLPDDISNLSSLSTSSYKIKGVDILYKEADSRAVKVVDTVALATIVDTTTNNKFLYKYQSSKPFRTLPENQTTRVFDKVPVLAQSQETAGNRIIYGNFKDKYTPPNFIQYKTAIAPKFTTVGYYNWAEYPNHSVKQNRNYQVGFILADKFGRQSSVILSNIKADTSVVGGVAYGGSTVYSPYNPANETSPTVRDWFGDALRIIVEAQITAATTDNTPDIPGLYANARGSGFDVIGNSTTITSSSPFTYKFTPTTTTNIPQQYDYLRGEYKDFVEVTITPTVDGSGEYTVTCDGMINKEIYELTGDPGSNVKYAYILNQKGWYSYKVVVKQQEQEYYNVYLPGIIKGYPDQTGVSPKVDFPDATKTSNIVLLNDNINKVPRDLTEVGPEQRQFRSSVELFGRVENTLTSNKQFYPRTNTNVIPLKDTAISISTASDSNMAFEYFGDGGNAPNLYSTLSTIGQNSVYQLDTNPLIARISTTQDIGIASTPASAMTPYLAVYETEPVESLLDIYWETSTVGLIADLNAAIATDFNGPVGFAAYTWTQPESIASGATFLTGVQPVDKDGTQLNGTSITNFASTNSAIALVNTSAAAGGYSFKITSPFVYTNTSAVNDVFTLSMNVTDAAGNTSGTIQLTGSLSNTNPVVNNVTAGQLPQITNNSGASGVVATYTGLNGSSDSTRNTDQLQWSIEGGNTLNKFSINASTGQLTQTSANAGTYNLTIRVTDANNGTGAAFAEANQKVVVSSTQVGYFFYGGPNGVFLQACPANGGQPTGCSSILYYSQSVLVNGRPTAGSVILQGSGGPGVSPVAVAGYYSIYQCATGASRWYIKISGSNGVIDAGYPISCSG